MGEKTSLSPLVLFVWTALFTALVAAGAYLSIPFWPVPFVMSNFFMALAGLVLGPIWGFVSGILYLGLGALNLPVFQGGSGGLSHFFGATGGFLLGFPLTALVAGLLRDAKNASIVRNVVAVLVGYIALYGVGVPFLAAFTKKELLETTLAMVPYMGGDVAKAILAGVLTKLLFTAIPALKSKG